MTQLIILAGGKGTRLHPVTGDAIPKSMVRVRGLPLLEHQVRLGARYGLSDIVILTSHLSPLIEKYFESGKRLGVSIRYLADTTSAEPRGTAGALIDALPILEDECVVFYGDTMLDVDLGRMLRWHRSRHFDFTLLVHPNDHPQDSDLVEIDSSDRVLEIHGYPRPSGQHHSNMVNAALYVARRSAIEWSKTRLDAGDIAKDLIPLLIDGQRSVGAYRSAEYIKDVGTPERLAKVEADIASGKVTACRYGNPRPALFLDRDGTLNVARGLIKSTEALELLPDVAAALRKINASKHLILVITNQPVVARGDITLEQLQQIHDKLETELGARGAYLDGIYFCPHHPDGGFDGEVPELKIACNCRKPKTGLFRKALRDFDVDLLNSFMVGDDDRDMQAAKELGIGSILVQTGDPEIQRKQDSVCDFRFATLSEAVDFVLDVQPRLQAAAREIVSGLGECRRIILGGPSKSGKSALAYFVKRECDARGTPSLHVQMDGWLQTSAKEHSGFQDRFANNEFWSFLERATTLQQKSSIEIPRYHRVSRQTRAQADILVIEPSSVLILEGVAAFLDERLLQQDGLKVFVDASESWRRQQFAADYRWRGEEDSHIDLLFDEREHDEVAQMKSHRPSADMKFFGLFERAQTLEKQ